MNPEYNPGTFLKQLIPHLMVGIDIRIKIGFSFIGVQFQDLKPKYSYFYAAEDLSSIQELFETKDEMMTFANNLENKKYDDFLKETFLASAAGERFSNSAIEPLQLVANYIWIRK